MDAITENNLKVLELLLRNNEFFDYSYDDLNFNIHPKKVKGEFALRKSQIRTIYFFNELVDQSRVQIVFEHAGYLYLNLTNGYIGMGL